MNLFGMFLVRSERSLGRPRVAAIDGAAILPGAWPLSSRMSKRRWGHQRRVEYRAKALVQSTAMDQKAVLLVGETLCLGRKMVLACESTSLQCVLSVGSIPHSPRSCDDL